MPEPGIARFADALRSLSAPEDLPSLAAQAVRLIRQAARPGALVIAHCVLLAVHAQAEGDELGPERWSAVRNVAEAVADLCEQGASIDIVDRLGRAFRDSLFPPAMH